MQMYRDSKTEAIAEYKLQELIQQSLAIEYITRFQIYAI
jgi:hypothetical protein